MNREERSGPPRMTGEAEAVELDRLQDFAALANAEAAIAGSGPDRALRVDADAVGRPSSSAHTRRFVRSPSASMSNAVSLVA